MVCLGNMCMATLHKGDNDDDDDDNNNNNNNQFASQQHAYQQKFTLTRNNYDSGIGFCCFQTTEPVRLTSNDPPVTGLFLFSSFVMNLSQVTFFCNTGAQVFLPP